MSSGKIRTLKPNVSQQEAIRAFAVEGWSAIYWRVRGGPLERVADAYVPYHLYTVRYRERAKDCIRRFALDAVEGSLDLFEFPKPPEERDFVIIETRNRLNAGIEGARADDLLKEKVLRVLFQRGFFRMSDPRLEVAREPVEMHVPYWLGFHQARGHVRCRVMDAVRRRIEGGKARALFENWLAA